MLGEQIPGDSLSVVIPCFNEEEVLSQTIDRVVAVVRSIGKPAEVVLVDDGSRDRTWAIIKQATEEHPEVGGYRLSRNFGHQSALTAGLHAARGDRILILDADLQDPPELLSAMMEKMDEGYHIVYGQRCLRVGETWFKKFTASVFYRFINLLSDITIPPDTGDFRLISRTALESFKQLPEHNRFIRGMFSWIGLPQAAFPYERAPRVAGTTKYNFRRMLAFAVDGITGFSIRPLKLALLLAFIMIVTAMVGLFWTIYSWALGGTVAGWASLLTASLIIGSCQLFVLGIIGEYLGRLFIETKRRPAFLIQSGRQPRIDFDVKETVVRQPLD